MIVVGKREIKKPEEIINMVKNIPVARNTRSIDIGVFCENQKLLSSLPDENVWTQIMGINDAELVETTKTVKFGTRQFAFCLFYKEGNAEVVGAEMKLQLLPVVQKIMKQLVPKFRIIVEYDNPKSNVKSQSFITMVSWSNANDYNCVESLSTLIQNLPFSGSLEDGTIAHVIGEKALALSAGGVSVTTSGIVYTFGFEPKKEAGKKFLKLEEQAKVKNNFRVSILCAD